MAEQIEHAEREVYYVSTGFGVATQLGVSVADVNSALVNQGHSADINIFDTQSVGYSLWLGWQLYHHVALELGYLDFGASSVDLNTLSSGGERALLDAMPTAGHGMSIALKPSYELSDNWTVTGRIGLMNWASDLELVDLKSDKSGTDLLLGAGLSYHLSEGWAVELSWDTTKMDQTQNHLVAFNIAYQFNW
nr:outer membrane beta-barrel protein [Vibrio intestinalis]